MERHLMQAMGNAKEKNVSKILLFSQVWVPTCNPEIMHLCKRALTSLCLQMLKFIFWTCFILWKMFMVKITVWLYKTAVDGKWMTAQGVLPKLTFLFSRTPWTLQLVLRLGQCQSSPFLLKWGYCVEKLNESYWDSTQDVLIFNFFVRSYAEVIMVWSP